MCKAIEEMLEEAYQEGFKEGFKKGFEIGRKEGEELMLALIRKLTPGSEDYRRALKGTAADRRELLTRYGIAPGSQTGLPELFYRI